MNTIYLSSSPQGPITPPRAPATRPRRAGPILPGPIRFLTGHARDLSALAHFHYAPTPPATFADVRLAVYDDPLRGPRTIGVGVLSWPVPNVRARLRHFELDPTRRRDNLALANANLRTISRVIVDPQFRSAGVASNLVRELIDRCPTRYVETIAQMGAIHPVFLVCGMSWLNEHIPAEKPYFLIDKHPEAPRPTAPTPTRAPSANPRATRAGEGEAPAEPSRGGVNRGIALDTTLDVEVNTAAHREVDLHHTDSITPARRLGGASPSRSLLGSPTFSTSDRSAS